MELSCGTLSYAAPEVLAKSYTSQCDLWSLGVIVFILLAARTKSAKRTATADCSTMSFLANVHV